jgi:hypothetical protein
LLGNISQEEIYFLKKFRPSGRNFFDHKLDHFKKEGDGHGRANLPYYETMWISGKTMSL